MMSTAEKGLRPRKTVWISLRLAVANLRFRSAALIAAIVAAGVAGIHIATRPCYDIFAVTQSGFAACASLEAIAIVDSAIVFALVIGGLKGVGEIGRRIETGSP